MSETNLQLINNIQLHATRSLQLLSIIGTLYENAATIATLSSQSLPNVDQLRNLCMLVGLRCHAIFAEIHKIKNDVDNFEHLQELTHYREQLDEVERRCLEAVAKIKQANALLETALPMQSDTDKLRTQIIRARAIEIEQRLKDGVLWRVAKLRASDE